MSQPDPVLAREGPDDADIRDPELLARVRARDPHALGQVFDAAFPYVYALAHRMLGERTQAEDAAQDVFAKVHRSAHRIDPERPLKPWLTTITLNACRDRLRRRARRRETTRDPVVLDGIGHGGENPEYSLVQEERRRRLTRALAELSDDQREIVTLHVFAGHSHEESAGLLGLTAAAVRKRYSRALVRLRALLRRDRP